jgi:hypothetical protein
MSLAHGQSAQSASGREETRYQRRSAEELSRYTLPGGGAAVVLDGWADHTIFAVPGPDGKSELVCLQGDTHALAAQVLAPGAPRPTAVGAAVPSMSGLVNGSRFASVNATLRVDRDVLAGADNKDRPLLYMPDPIAPGSSRSHFDRRATPNLLMEPNISLDLKFGSVDLTDDAMRDMGWPGGRFVPMIDYADAAGTGFHDATLAADRQAAMQYVANRWSRLLGGRQTVNIRATYNELQCVAGQGAVLAAAGPTFVFQDVPGGEPGVWYPGATAEAVARTDLSGTEFPDADPADLVIFFNSAIDDECLGTGTGYYYGLDGNTPAGQISFVTVAMHEMGHGLGFTGLTDLQSGALFLGDPDIFTTKIFDNVADKSWDEMTRAQRRRSAIRDGQVAFTGKRARRGARKLLGAASVITINGPDTLKGTHVVGTATFGPALRKRGLRGDLALVNDGSANPTLGCVALTNGGEIAGKIAVVDRGECTFVAKVQAAENAGAVAVIIVNNEPGLPAQFSGLPTATITIPTVMVGMELGQDIKDELES